MVHVGNWKVHGAKMMEQMRSEALVPRHPHGFPEAPSGRAGAMRWLAGLALHAAKVQSAPAASERGLAPRVLSMVWHCAFNTNGVCNDVHLISV